MLQEVQDTAVDTGDHMHSGWQRAVDQDLVDAHRGGTRALRIARVVSLRAGSSCACA